jgi:sulfite reductase beta subunit-like hemoprotein
MYKYNAFDEAFLAERNAQFRAQVARRIDGSLTEDEFKPLRLMNGVYLQLHAYMLRVAIPYGTLNSDAPWRCWQKSGTRAMATSPPARTSSTTGPS